MVSTFGPTPTSVSAMGYLPFGARQPSGNRRDDTLSGRHSGWARWVAESAVHVPKQIAQHDAERRGQQDPEKTELAQQDEDDHEDRRMDIEVAVGDMWGNQAAQDQL